MVQQLSTNTFGVAKWIVSATASDGTHTTIASALTSASSGDTIFVRDGTYTENLTLKAGVNITAFTGDSQEPTVTIIGKATATTAGTFIISNIRLQTNSDFFLVVSGTAATIVRLINCFLNCTNNTGISSTSTLSSIFLEDCNGNIGTTGISLFSVTAAGGMDIKKCYITNSGNSTTASTTSSGLVTFKNSIIDFPLTTSSGGSMNGFFSNFETGGINTTSFTSAGTGVPVFHHCQFEGGTSSAISIGSGTTVNMWGCEANSSNTNVITGAGELRFTPIAFSGTSAGVNVTTITPTTSFGPDIKNLTQPCVTAIVNANTSNNTGDGTAYTVIFNTAQFDQSSSFNTTTGIFTAKYTQKYLFISSVRASNLTAAATSGVLQLATTGGTYFLDQNNIGAIRDASSVAILNGSAIVAMTAGDTASIIITVSNTTKTIGISGNNATPFISFVSIYALP